MNSPTGPENQGTGSLGGDGQKQVSRRPQTIECVACNGNGYVGAFHLAYYPPTGRERCDLCNGTGREPIPNHDKDAQRAIEGESHE